MLFIKTLSQDWQLGFCKWKQNAGILSAFFLFICMYMFTKKRHWFAFFSPQYWEKAEFPFQLIPKIGALLIAGGTIKVIPLWLLVLKLISMEIKYDVWLLRTCRVMDARVSPSLQVLLQLQKLLELMQASQLLSWCIHLWPCLLSVRSMKHFLYIVVLNFGFIIFVNISFERLTFTYDLS